MFGSVRLDTFEHTLDSEVRLFSLLLQREFFSFYIPRLVNKVIQFSKIAVKKNQKIIGL